MHVHEKPARRPEQHANLAPLRAAYQGIAGAFGEEAVRRLWHGRAEAIPARTFAAALDELVGGRVQWAVIPIWNSTIGPVAPARAALRACGSTVTVARQLDIPVRHCLLALPGTSIADVRFVGSHPAALAQCAKLFTAHPELTPCDAFDTAGAARELSMLSDPASGRLHDNWYSSVPVDAPSRLAVIASANAGRRYGLSILREGVQDDPENLTRFVVVRATEPARW
jgi:prephenate dehydratase